MMTLLMIYLIWTGIRAYSGLEAGYLTLYLHYFIIIFSWNIFDLFIMDWLIFCSITPKFLVLPGTSGNPAYKNYKFHINGSIGKGLIYAIVFSSIIAGITFILLKIF